MATNLKDKCNYLNYDKPQRSWLVYLYSFFAISSTLFELYGISYSLSTFTWRFASVCLFSFFAFLNICAKGFQINKENIYFIPFFVSVIISFFTNMAIGSDGYELRLIRFMLLFAFAIFLSPRYFDASIAMNIYKWIVWIATFVLLLQVLLSNVWGIYFSGHLNLPLRSSIYAEMHSISRFYSIFEEPGYYGIFVSSYLCIKLAEHKIHTFELFAIAIALLLSTSSSNLGLLFFVMTYYIAFIDVRNNHIKTIVAKAGVLLVAAFSFYLFSNSKQFLFVSNRLEAGHSLNSRTEGYIALDSFFNANPLIVMFGNGMEFYPISGYATLIIVFGVVGAVFYLVGVAHLLRKTNFIGKFILITFLFSNIGNVEFLGNASSMLIVFPFVLWYCRHSSFCNRLNSI